MWSMAYPAPAPPQPQTQALLETCPESLRNPEFPILHPPSLPHTCFEGPQRASHHWFGSLLLPTLAGAQLTPPHHAGAMGAGTSLVILLLDQSVAQFIGIASQWLLSMELCGGWAEPTVHGLMVPHPASLHSPDTPCPCTGLPHPSFPGTAHSARGFRGQGVCTKYSA